MSKLKFINKITKKTNYVSRETLVIRLIKFEQ